MEVQQELKLLEEYRNQQLQFKFNNMKSINQFDYPSKEAQSFKGSSLISDCQDNKDQIKTRYKQNLQYHKELQRNKAKQNQKLKQQLESKRKKQLLQSELENKKRQLQNLEVLKQQAEQNQKKSFELALLKEQQDRIKKQQNQIRKQQFDQNATLRFSQAMKKLQDQKQEQSFKQRLAEKRRKTAQQFQKIERAKAEKYRSFVEEKEKNNEKQKQSTAEDYRKTFKQYITSPNQDYNRTCLHNLKVVPQIQIQQENAFDKGKVQANEIRQKSEERRRKNEENDRKSKQRGRQALLRMQREREYENFEKQTSEEQKKYNMERIEAGKKNQFVGIKPTTLSQMQISKKMRSEEQFDKMFFSNSVQPVQSANKPATKYEIVERRIPVRKDQNSDSDEKPRKVKSYLKKKQESEMPAVSEGKYSFEQQCYSEFKNQSQSQSQSQSHISDQTQENQEDEDQTNHYERANLKNALKQTRIPDEKPRASPKQENKNLGKEQKRQTLSKNDKKHLSKTNQNQPQAFDTNSMLKKYGISKQTLPKQEEEKKQEGKRKVVQLANICENRQPEKEELNYSSESEEDSLT